MRYILQTHTIKMREINDFEVSSLKGLSDVTLDERSGMPRFISAFVRAVRCDLCDKIYFANSRKLFYECMKCR